MLLRILRQRGTTLSVWRGETHPIRALQLDLYAEQSRLMRVAESISAGAFPAVDMETLA